MDENDDDDEVIVLDHRAANPTSSSGSILVGLNQFNIGTSDEVKKLSKEKWIILAVTCISIGMFTGLWGSTLPYLSENIPSVIWLITGKSSGFLIGIYLSSYFFTWFNIYCLLGISCLSISVGVCALPFITNSIIFYFVSLILGIGLGLVYNGMDVLYTRVCNQSSIRWLHLLIPLGAILSTLLLFLSTMPSVQTNTTQFTRSRRAAISNDSILSVNQSTMLTTLSLTTERLTSQASCIKSYCCYDQNNFNETFICYENIKNQSQNCHDVLSLCRLRVCNINNTLCLINPICGNQTMYNCLKESTIIPISKTTSQTRAFNRTSTPTSNHRVTTDDYYHKMDLIYHSVTSIHYLYFFLALLFFILGIFYSKLAIQRERVTSSLIKDLNPLSLIIIKPYPIVLNPNIQISFCSDHLSLALLVLILFFYFILSGIESSCNYLTYSLGIALKLSKTKSLFLQLCYLSGRLIDLSINYTWFLFNKQTDKIPLKFFILLRLIILFLLSFFNLFQHYYHFLFLSIGYLLASLSNLILSWIERHFCLNDIFLQMILSTIVISESIFPIILFYHLEHFYFLQIFFLIALCLLMILFLSILYLTQKWQGDRSYRLLSTSMEMESGENSDNELSKFH